MMFCEVGDLGSMVLLFVKREPDFERIGCLPFHEMIAVETSRIIVREQNDTEYAKAYIPSGLYNGLVGKPRVEGDYCARLVTYCCDREGGLDFGLFGHTRDFAFSDAPRTISHVTQNTYQRAVYILIDNRKMIS